MLASDRDARQQIEPTRPRWWAVGVGFVLGVMVGGTLVGLRACRDTAERPQLDSLPGPRLPRR